MGLENEECLRCGLETTSFSYGARLRHPTPLGAPWRVLETLRDHRSMQPVPAFYVSALVVGTGLGVAIDWLTGFRWWRVPVAALAGSWLYFQSSAFVTPSRSSLGLDLKVALRPSRSLELRAAETERAFRAAPFALFGLDETWPGDRWLAGFASSNGQSIELHLGHSREAVERQERLVVGVRARLRRRGGGAGNLASDLGRFTLETGLTERPSIGAVEEGEAAWPDSDPGSMVVIRVDEEPVEFRTLKARERWIAVGHVGESIITLDAKHFEIDRVSLKTVVDLEPYIAGARERTERMRRSHEAP